MTLGSKEHYEVISLFERIYKVTNPRYESREIQEKGFIYQNGELNRRFIDFRSGYAAAKCVYQQQPVT